jgi:hypothetical protein
MIEIDITFDSKCVDIIRIPNASTLIASKCMPVNCGILVRGIDCQQEVNL